MKKRVEASNIVLVAEKQGKIIGVIEGRDGSHIARFFVDELHQRQGIGRFLFDALIDEFTNEGNKPDCITVNSSPCAVKAYESLGFHKTGEEEIGNPRQPFSNRCSAFNVSFKQVRIRFPAIELFAI